MGPVPDGAVQVHHLPAQDARFALAQARYGLGGVLASLPGCQYVNHPHAIADAEFKPAQLAAAHGDDLLDWRYDYDRLSYSVMALPSGPTNAVQAWLEAPTGLPMSAALADLLVRGSR
jgi:hypothetical protein